VIAMNKKDVNIVFMGTTEFAGGMLTALLENDYNVIGVVCQPDKPVGRKKILEFPFTKKIAVERGIDVFQPLNIREDSKWLEDKKPDLIVTCAYGQIVPQKVLDIPSLGCINVHGSLLPALRGAAPIQYAILNDLKVTGITIMQMVKKMDAGDMFSKCEVEVSNTDTGDSLFKKMELAARDLLIKTLPDYIDGKLEGEVQNEEFVTFAPSIKREEEIICWNNSKRSIYNKIRALNSVPGAYTLLDGMPIKIYETEEVDINYDGKNGEIVEVLKDRLVVKTTDGAIAIKELQPSGKKRMHVRDFLNGNKDLKGKVFHE
jgi:methionyl-tRNA formyltransferase